MLSYFDTSQSDNFPNVHPASYSMKAYAFLAFTAVLSAAASEIAGKNPSATVSRWVVLYQTLMCTKKVLANIFRHVGFARFRARLRIGAPDRMWFVTVTFC